MYVSMRLYRLLHACVKSSTLPANKVKIRIQNTYVSFYVPLFLLSLNIITLPPFTAKPVIFKTQVATTSTAAVRCFVEVKTFCTEPVIFLSSVRNS